MSKFTQYADCNFYHSHSTSDGRIDDNGYHDHRTLDRDIIVDVSLLDCNHPHADEIAAIMNDVYRPEDLPSNGSTDGHIRGNLVHNADTRDLAEQAKNPPVYWNLMMLAYQANIRKLARWIGGYNPVTKDAIRFDTKLRKTKARMKSHPVYARKLAKRWDLLKMCNKALS